jgi:hypothetical protein
MCQRLRLRQLLWWIFVVYNLLTLVAFLWLDSMLVWGITVLLNTAITVAILWGLKRSRWARHV